MTIMASLDDPNGSFDEADVDDINDDDDVASLEQGDSPNRKSNRRKRDITSLRKAPQAPKRFKSSYICFFMAKQTEIKEELGDQATVTAISKRSAEMWKNLPPEERAHWDDVAAKDKARFMVEKASYTGPWHIPWKRVRKDPSAPKRPMSAFLYYSQGKRTQIKAENPDIKNTQISRMLGEMWRNLSDEERQPFIEKEKEEREKYKTAIADWKRENAARQEAMKRAQAEQAMIPAAQVAPVPQPLFNEYNVGGSPMGNPYVYPPYPAYAYPPAGPFPFPTNGKHPVILGPNGMPHYGSASQGKQTSPPPGLISPPAHNTYAMSTLNAADGLDDGAQHSLDYGGDHSETSSKEQSQPRS